MHSEPHLEECKLEKAGVFRVALASQVPPLAAVGPGARGSEGEARAAERVATRPRQLPGSWRAAAEREPQPAPRGGEPRAVGRGPGDRCDAPCPLQRRGAQPAPELRACAHALL